MTEFEILAIRALESLEKESQEQTKLLRSIDAKLSDVEPKYAKPLGISFVPAVH
jgi:hypothetical protein